MPYHYSQNYSGIFPACLMTTSSSITTAIPAIAVTSTIIFVATATASIHTDVITSPVNATANPTNNSGKQ